jgi:3-oxoadipate CoA-transferase, alpha subunit
MAAQLGLGRSCGPSYPRSTAVTSSKLIDLRQATGLVVRGNTVMVGGFGLVGKPLALVEELLQKPEATELTVISNNLGEPGTGLGRLLLEGRISKAVGSFFTSNPDAVSAHSRGELEVELTPQGTLSEAIRAGGAGIPAFYTRTGVGTKLAERRETREFGGVVHLLWPALHANVALIRARSADAFGNLVYEKTARNFNPDMATAADLVIAQVDEIVPVGDLDPEAIVTPHLLVDHLVLTPKNAATTRTEAEDGG